MAGREVNISNESAAEYGGLRDLFPAFYPPTLDEQRSVITEGLVCLDTNVLLDLYRYRPAARAELLAVLGLLSDRLFVPNRAALEFQRGRLGAVADHLNEYKSQISAMNAAKEQAVSALNTITKRRSLAEQELSQEIALLEDAFDRAKRRIAQMAEEYDLHPDRLAQHDPIRESLDTLLAGRIGRPLTDEHLASVRKKFTQPNRELLPGDSDSKRKPIELAEGDYVLWTEIKQEAARRMLPVLFVSSDDKKDWVRREAGRTERPRRELVEEMLHECGTRLLMLPTAQFLELTRDYLDAVVSPATVDEVATTERSGRRRPPVPVRRSDGEPTDAWFTLARCCTPLPGEEIVGSVIRGNGIRVHRRDCANLEILAQRIADGQRSDDSRIPVQWTDENLFPVELSLRLLVEDHTDVLGLLAETLAELSAKVLHISSTTARHSGPAAMDIRIQVYEPVPVEDIMDALAAIPGVVRVDRSSEDTDTRLLSAPLGEVAPTLVR